MKSFILISFGVLAWVFFELSGGMDFQTPVNPALAHAGTTEKAKAKAVVVEIATTALIVPKIEPEITLAIADDPDSGFSPITDIEDTPAITLISLEQSGDQVGGLLDGFDPNAIGLSALAPADVSEPEVFVEPELPPVDLREVTGTRVNMRSGPGTIYDVITRVTLGEPVEVLDASGGWLRLRLVSNRTVGWISASLVSKAPR